MTAKRTPDQLRDAIDRGATGDKVPGLDPAAVPFGTDDEASGNTSPAADAATALPGAGAHRPIAGYSGQPGSTGAFVASLAAVFALCAGALLLLIR
jgi:hypothetical protein